MENSITTMDGNTIKAIERTPGMIAAEIRAYTGTMLSAVLEIGRRFCEAKEMLPHGQFGDWVRDQTGYPMSTANNYMRLFKEYGADQGSLFGASANSQTIGNLSYTKALALLEVPAEDRETFAQAVDAEGISVRELKEAIRERDEKLAEAENVAEGYRIKLESEKLARESALREREEELLVAQSKVDELYGQLRELKERPQEVTVETVVDTEAVKKAADEAKTETEKKLKAKIEKAERERDRARADKEKAEKAKAEAERKLAEAGMEREAGEAQAKKAQELAAGQIAEPQKKLAVASSSELTVFKLHFEQGKAAVNAMLDCADKLRDAGDKEGAGKLRGILRKFLEAAIGSLEGAEA